jgi:hypothetical protein
VDHSKLHPYPKSLPDGWLLHLISVARGNIDAKREVHFIWHVAGYSASQFDVHAVMGAAGSDPLAALEACAASGTEPNWADVSAVCNILTA